MDEFVNKFVLSGCRLRPAIYLYFIYVSNSIIVSLIIAKIFAADCGLSKF